MVFGFGKENYGVMIWMQERSCGSIVLQCSKAWKSRNYECTIFTSKLRYTEKVYALTHSLGASPKVQ
jgi:hypothetical protein